MTKTQIKKLDNIVATTKVERRARGRKSRFQFDEVRGQIRALRHKGLPFSQIHEKLMEAGIDSDYQALINWTKKEFPFRKRVKRIRQNKAA